MSCKDAVVKNSRTLVNLVDHHGNRHCPLIHPDAGCLAIQEKLQRGVPAAGSHGCIGGRTPADMAGMDIRGTDR